MLGLVLAQWYGFAHRIHHVHEIHDIQNQKVDLTHSLSDDDLNSHHCAAYDSLTLGSALILHPPILNLVDVKHAAIKRYQIYQISIEALAPFEARAPPTKHV
ncbi:MAG: hypothetical protein RLZZ410_1041 [Pseudomonadota bacterium]